MLTFEFTGINGLMTVPDELTSGMVGREAALSFDDSWAELTKTVVFRAGEVCRIVQLVTSPVTIPADVLAHPFCKLYVGVCGTDAEGALVIPTIMAEGPYIRYGADPTSDPTAEHLPVWRKLQNQIGDLSDLDTEAKDDLVAAINELRAAIPNAGHASGGGSGLSSKAAALLITILRQAVYSANQSANIDALEEALSAPGEDTGSSAGGSSGSSGGTGDSTGGSTGSSGSGSGSEDGENGDSGSDTGDGGDSGDEGSSGSGGGTTDPVSCSVTNNLTNVTTSNSSASVTAGESYSATLTAAEGYRISSVTVTMGGADVTGSSYANGQISISSVTGSIVITAAAAEMQAAESETLVLVHAKSYPNVTTFEYTEATSAGQYTVAKRGQLAGGKLSVTYDPAMANGWNLNLYVFDGDGNPYLQTDKENTDNTVATYWTGETTPCWEAVGAGAGFGVVSAPFTVQIPDGCTFIACMRRGSGDYTGDSSVIGSTSAFSEWVVNGGVTFTVTTYE